MLLEVRPLGRVVSMKCAMVRPKTMLEIESKVFTVTIMFPTQPFSTTFSGDEDVGPGLSAPSPFVGAIICSVVFVHAVVLSSKISASFFWMISS